MVNKRKNLREFKALIVTPYLKRELDYTELTSDQGRKVFVEKAYGCLDENFFMPQEIEKLPSQGNLIFIGSTRDSERAVETMSTRGTPIVRYSKFYGGRSEYTSKSAAEGGYSFDMPKDPKIVRVLLESDAFLESLLERDLKKVKTALESLNKKLKQPVLTTYYLESVFR
jgi:hypothetical protein